MIRHSKAEFDSRTINQSRWRLTKQFCLFGTAIMVMLFWLQSQSSLHSMRATPNKKVDSAPSVTIQNVVNGSVPEDHLMPEETTPRTGKLVYSFTNKSERENNNPTCYLVLRTMRAETPNSYGSQSTGVLTFTLKVNNGVAFDPLFSPDGNHILVKIGFGTMRYDPFRLSILDLKTNSIKLLSQKQLRYRLVLWSPDSRYIAYFIGGDAEGSGDSRYTKPLELWICDRVTGKERLVEKNATLESNIAWGEMHTLYYGMLSKPLSAKKSATPQRPNIWAFSVEESKSRLIIRDGYRPNIASNNESIAFYGSQNPAKPTALNDDWIWRTGDAALTVMHANGKRRKPLSVMEGESTFSIWKRDGRHLLTLRQKSETPKGRSEVKEWDIITGKHRIVGELEANDYEESPRMSIYPSIRPVSVSADDRFLLSITQEYVGAEDQWLNQVDSIKAIDLISGKVSTVARIMNSLGTDWREDTPSPVENASMTPGQRPSL